MDIYQRIFEFTPDALLVVGSRGHIILANDQVSVLFGHDPNQLIGQPIERLIPARFSARHVAHRDKFMNETRSRPMGKSSDLYALHRDGHEFPVDIMLSPMLDNGQPLVLCVVRDITQRKLAEAQLRQQTAELQRLHAELKERANRDGLTGLFNRRAFFELAEQMLKTAQRRQESMTVFMVDLDHFKQVNDQFGHAEGDHVLKMTAAALHETARGNDIVARYGGEEFVVAIVGSSAAESLAAAERLREAIAAITQIKLPITASIGVASMTPPPHSGHEANILAELLEHADRALYAAKRNGRNQVIHYDRLPRQAIVAASTAQTPGA